MKTLLQRTVLGIAACLLASGTYAAEITPEQALARLAQQGTAAPAKAGVAPRLVHTALSEKGTPAAYVFNRSTDGFLVLSADDNALPLLGYSDSGEFDAENIAPALQWWLEEYGRQIEYAAEHSASTTQSSGLNAALTAARANRQAIAPMIKTSWDQTEPYNDLCPLSLGIRCYTGCVATAMAQVMKYWEHPKQPKGYISYTLPSLQKAVSMDLSKRALDWDNMLDVYYGGEYSEKEADAVAYLMKACGYSVKMDYGTDSSGALAMNTRAALVKYFDYDPSSEYCLRFSYSTTEWENLIYEGLKTGPILYGGASMIGGGHSFVCDGYDGNGFFHFNWGWTGMSNGYFSLDALNPEALGSGGGAGGGYNFTQDAVIGIQPNTGKPFEEPAPQLTQMGQLEGEILVGNILNVTIEMQTSAQWVNYNPSTMNVSIAAAFEPVAGGETKYAKFIDDVIEIPAGYGLGPENFSEGTKVQLSSVGLADGTYKVYVASLENKADAQWLPVKPCYGYAEYFTLTKRGNLYSLTNADQLELSIVDGGLVRDYYYGALASVFIEVENPTDIELTRGFAPMFFNTNGQALLLGESIMLTVAPHSKVRREWSTSPVAMQSQLSFSQPTPVVFTFMDEGTYNVLAEQFMESETINPNPGVPEITLTTTPTIEGASRRPGLMLGVSGYIYTVTDRSDIHVSANVKLTSGYFGYPMYATLAIESEDTEMAGSLELLTMAGGNVFIEKPGDIADFDAHLAYPQGEAGKLYYLVMTYALGSQLVPFAGGRAVGIEFATDAISSVKVDGNITFKVDKASAKVNAYSDNEIVSMEAVSVSGVTVARSESSALSLEGLKGLFIVTARDNAGHTSTTKISI